LITDKFSPFFQDLTGPKWRRITICTAVYHDRGGDMTPFPYYMRLRKFSIFRFANGTLIKQSSFRSSGDFADLLGVLSLVNGMKQAAGSVLITDF